MTDLLVSLRLRATDGVSAVARKVRSELGKIGEAAKAAKKVSEGAADLEAARGRASAFASGTRSAIADLVSSSDTFEDKMALLSAESGKLSGEQLSKMSDAIYDVAQSTRFTSDVVQDGMLEMANAGFTAEQSIAALGPAARLATVTGASLAQTALFTSKSIRGFGLEASEATRVTDVMRAGAGEAGMQIDQMGELLGKVAPRAKGLGDTLEGTATLIAAFGKAGITGAEGATAIEDVFKRLGSGETDAGFRELGIDPKRFSSAADLMGALAAKTAHLSKTTREHGFAKHFGEAGFAVARLTEGIRDGTINMSQLREQMEGSAGTVEELFGLMDNGAGSSHRLGETWKELKNTLGKALSPAVDSLKDTLADALEGIVNFAKANPWLVKALGYTAVAVAGVATLISGALSIALAVVSAKAALVFIGGFAGVAKVLGGLLVGFGGAAKMLAGPVLFAIKALLLPLKLLTAGLLKTFVVAAGAAAPFIAIGLAIGAVTLAVQQLVKHWDELDFLEGIKGIAESIGDSGILSTLGELFDPRTLLKDVGLMDSENRIVPGVGAPGASGRSEVSGAIAIKVDSEGRARVDRAESKGGIALDVDTGYTLAGATGGL